MVLNFFQSARAFQLCVVKTQTTLQKMSMNVVLSGNNSAAFGVDHLRFRTTKRQDFFRLADAQYFLAANGTASLNAPPSAV
jgi:hypothetical protein